MTIRTRITLLHAATSTAAGLALLVAAFLLNSANLVRPAVGPDGTRPEPSHTLPVLLGVLLVLFALATLGLGWFVAGRILAPLRRITDVAQGIAAGNLHERINLPGRPDELRRLADTFDGMLARLEAAFQAQRRFAANASHELLTPLATTRALLEVNPDVPTLLMVNQLSTELVESLLDLSRADHGLTELAEVDLADLTEHALASLDTQDREVTAHLDPAPLRGDPRLLTRLVGNLLANAVRHNHPGGAVHLAVAPGELTVANTGPVVPAELAERLFEPFFRAGGRTSGGGHGIGLALARAVVTAHGGTITATPNPEGGLTVRVRFLVLAG